MEQNNLKNLELLDELKAIQKQAKHYRQAIQVLRALVRNREELLSRDKSDAIWFYNSRTEIANELKAAKVELESTINAAFKFCNKLTPSENGN